MSLTVHSITYGSQTINFELRRSMRKTLAIHVHPDMRIEVIAPATAELEKIEKKVQKRAKWIKKQQLFFEQFYPKTLKRLYVSGESHYYLGRQFRLKITRGLINKVKTSGGFIHVSSHYPNNQKLNTQLIEDWFKARANEKFKERLALCIVKFSNPENFTPHSLVIRQMSNRWGSMTATKRLVLNTKLIHAPIHCIDYVIIHELCHIKHSNHGPDFWKLLDLIMPDWKISKNKLEKCLNQ